MEWFLVILGVLCLGLGFITEHPKFREKVIRPWVERQWAQEEAKIKQTRQEAEKAREDVAMLLAELDRASDKVVELMTGWADKAQEKVQATPKITESNPSTQTKAKSLNKQKRETKTKGNTLNELNMEPINTTEYNTKVVNNKDTKNDKINNTKNKDTKNKDIKTRQKSSLVSIESAKSLRMETSNTEQRKKNYLMKDKYITVLNLAEQGLSITDIAQSAKIGRGEVQLLLDLQNRGDKH